MLACYVVIGHGGESNAISSLMKWVEIPQYFRFRGYISFGSMICFFLGHRALGALDEAGRKQMLAVVKENGFIHGVRYHRSRCVLPSSGRIVLKIQATQIDITRSWIQGTCV